MIAASAVLNAVAMIARRRKWMRKLAFFHVESVAMYCARDMKYCSAMDEK